MDLSLRHRVLVAKNTIMTSLSVWWFVVCHKRTLIFPAITILWQASYLEASVDLVTLSYHDYILKLYVQCWTSTVDKEAALWSLVVDMWYVIVEANERTSFKSKLRLYYECSWISRRTHQHQSTKLQVDANTISRWMGETLLTFHFYRRVGLHGEN